MNCFILLVVSTSSIKAYASAMKSLFRLALSMPNQVFTKQELSLKSHTLYYAKLASSGIHHAQATTHDEACLTAAPSMHARSSTQQAMHNLQRTAPSDNAHASTRASQTAKLQTMPGNPSTGNHSCHGHAQLRCMQYPSSGHHL